MKRALAYIRVSREDENPENQIEEIRKWAEANNIQVLGWYIDVDVSGVTKPRERPQYKAMIDVAKKLKVELILFYDLSRLARNVEYGLEELKNLTDDGFDFKFVGQAFLDYIEDKMLKKKVIMDFLWFAELYREDIRRRTKIALERLKREGKKLGRPKYPFPADKIKKLLNEGWSIAKIHRYLVSLGKICRETTSGKRDCMKYETFRRKVKALKLRFK